MQGIGVGCRELGSGELGLCAGREVRWKTDTGEVFGMLREMMSSFFFFFFLLAMNFSNGFLKFVYKIYKYIVNL